MFHHDHDHNDNCNTTHPRDRAPQADDPMEMNGIEIEGDPLMMLDSIVEEYARMGADCDAILRMFDDPFFQGPYGLTRAYGRQFIRHRVEEILARCGVLQVRVLEQEPPAEEQNVTLTVGGRAVARED